MGPGWALEGRTLDFSMYPTRADTSERIPESELVQRDVHFFLLVNGVKTELPRRGASFSVAIDFGGPGRKTYAWHVTERGGLEQTSEGQSVDVLPDTKLRLPARTEVGPLMSGCGPQEHCATLDLNRSSRHIGVPLILRRLPADGTEEVGLVLRDRAQQIAELAVNTKVPITLAPDSDLSVCYSLPGCGSEAVAGLVPLEVMPEDPRLQDEARKALTVVAADVHRRGFVACNLWWMLSLIGVLGVGYVAWGLLSPGQFPQAAQLPVAERELQIKRAAPRPVRSAAGGRKGFYRSACCSFDSVGHTVALGTPYVLRLIAGKGGSVRIVVAGSVVARKLRGAWHPLSINANEPKTIFEGSIVSGKTYRVNDAFFFRLDL